MASWDHFDKWDLDADIKKSKNLKSVATKKDYGDGIAAQLGVKRISQPKTIGAKKKAEIEDKKRKDKSTNNSKTGKVKRRKSEEKPTQTQALNEQVLDVLTKDKYSRVAQWVNSSFMDNSKAQLQSDNDETDTQIPAPDRTKKATTNSTFDDTNISSLIKPKQRKISFHSQCPGERGKTSISKNKCETPPSTKLKVINRNVNTQLKNNPHSSTKIVNTNSGNTMKRKPVTISTDESDFDSSANELLAEEYLQRNRTQEDCSTNISKITPVRNTRNNDKNGLSNEAEKKCCARTKRNADGNGYIRSAKCNISDENSAMLVSDYSEEAVSQNSSKPAKKIRPASFVLQITRSSVISQTDITLPVFQQLVDVSHEFDSNSEKRILDAVVFKVDLNHDQFANRVYTKTLFDSKGVDLHPLFVAVIDKYEPKKTNQNNEDSGNFFITLNSRFEVMKTKSLEKLELLPEELSDKPVDTDPVRVFTSLSKRDYLNFFDESVRSSIPDLIITRLYRSPVA